MVIRFPRKATLTVMITIGLGVILSKVTVVTQSMIYASALALSRSLNEAEISQGWLYPEIGRIRDVSVFVAMGVIRAAEEAGVARETHIKSLTDEDLEKWVRSKMYEPYSEIARVEADMQAMLGDLPKVNGTAGSMTHKESHL